MIRFAPQAATSTPTPLPRARETSAAGLEQESADGVAASLLLISDQEMPVAASGRKAKSRGAKKPKAAAVEPAVQLDLAT